MLGTFSGGGLGIGIAFSLYDDFSATATEIEASMGGLGVTAEATAATVNASMNSMFLGAGLIAAGFAALIPVGMGLKWAGQFEQARVGLETFLGTQQKATEAFANIKEDVLHSATFTIEPLLRVNMALISTGQSAADARSATNALANAVAATGGHAEQLTRVGLELQHISNTGKVTNRNMLQFGYNGINMMKLLEKSTGKTHDQLEGIPITYDMITAALKRANEAGGLYYGAAERQSKTINGVLSNLEHEWQFFLAGIGDAVQPMFRVLVLGLKTVVEALAKFTATPFGQQVVRVITVLAVLMISLGVFILLSAVARFGIYKMAGAFGELTKSMILQAIAQDGVIAGFRVMAVAAWESLGPYILIAAGVAAILYGLYKLNQMISSNSVQLRNWAYTIFFLLGPIGWVIGGVMALIQGVKDFNGLMAGTTRNLGGVMGVFQRLGGIIKGVIEIFSTYDTVTNTFSLSDKLESSLKSLGILDIVISLGTWIARIAALWEGFRSGIIAALRAAKIAIVDILTVLAPGEEKLNNWNDIIAKATSNMDTWRAVGKAAAYVILGILAAILLSLGAIAIETIIAFAPMIAIGYLLYEIWGSLKKQWDNLTDGVQDGILGMLGILWDFMKWFLFSAFMGKQWGDDLVDKMQEGIAESWPKLSAWFQNQLGEMIAGKSIWEAYKKIDRSIFGNTEANKAGDVGFKDNPTGVSDPDTNPFNPFATPQKKSDISKGTTQVLPLGIGSAGNTPQGGSGGAPDATAAPISVQTTIPIYLDSKLISTHVIDNMQGKESRKN